MSMFCQHCGNSLAPESLFCNRCGSKASNPKGAGARRAGRPAAPPRPARRAPVIPSAPDQESYEEYEYEEDYPERRDKDYREDFADQDQVIFSITPTFYEVLPSYLVSAVLSLIVAGGVCFFRGIFGIGLIVTEMYFL